MIMRFLRDQRGVTVTFVALLMPVIIAFLGLVIDGGTLFLSRQRLDAAVDAASLAAAKKGYDQEIWDNEGRVVLVQSNCETAAREYFLKNYPDADITAFNVTIDSVTQNKVSVFASINAPVFFMRLFGINSSPISSKTESVAQ